MAEYDLNLTTDIERSGIQEKYLKHCLTIHESLTFFDVQRFVKAMGLTNQIQVLPFDVEQIGIALHQKRIQHSHSNQPYDILSMIQVAPAPPQAQWISVITHVKNKDDVTYEINPGFAITESERNNIADKLNQAMKYQSQEDETCQAFPHVKHIAPTWKTIGKQSEYTILHRLFQHDSIKLSDNERAKAFAQIDDKDTNRIREQVVKIELDEIDVTTKDNALLSESIKSTLDNGKIKPAILNMLTNHTLPPSLLAGPPQSLITDKLADIRPTDPRIIFPGQASEVLTALDYEQFLTLLSEKYSRLGLNLTLNELEFTCQNEQAIIGLIAFNQKQFSLPAKRLTLDLTPLVLSTQENRDKFLLYFKTMLLTMSDKNLAELTIKASAESLNEAEWNELTSFINDRSIAIDITLPEHLAHSPQQRLVDESTSDAIFQRRMTLLTHAITKAAPTPREGVGKKRPVGQKQTISTDIELQEEQQVEVAVQAQNAINQMPNQQDDRSGDIAVLTLQDFLLAATKGKFSKNSDSQADLIDIAYPNLVEIWCKWTGRISWYEANLFWMSKPAIEALFRYQSQFEYGLDLQNLPSGFSIRESLTEGKQSFIHFDPAQALTESKSPLKVQLKTAYTPTIITHQAFNRLLADFANRPLIDTWREYSNRHPDYDRVLDRTFKRFLPRMLRLSDPVGLFNLCLREDGALNPENLEFLMTHRTALKTLLQPPTYPQTTHNKLVALFGENKIQALRHWIQASVENDELNISAELLNSLIAENVDLKIKVDHLLTQDPKFKPEPLLALYLEYGESGVNALNNLSLTNKTVLTKLIHMRVYERTSYAPFLNDSHQRALNLIKSFSPSETAWWDTLLAQHLEANQDIDLVDLVDAFAAFKQALTKFTPPLELPENCELANVKSLPVALSRILTILANTHEQNQLEQWQVIHQLDLSSTGAVRPMTAVDEIKFAFVTPQMQINGAHERKLQNDDIELFDACTDSLANGFTAPKKSSDIGRLNDKIVEDYFRFVAKQPKNGQLALDFYRLVNDTLQNCDFSREVKNRLYRLIAAGTTGVRTVEGIPSHEFAIKAFNEIITSITNVPVPVMPANKQREILLSSIDRLPERPSLVILNKLIRLIRSRLTGFQALSIDNLHALNALNSRLYIHVQLYRSAVYDGMRSYSDADYKNEDLFEEYLDLLDCAKENLPDNETYAIQVIRILSQFHLKAAELQEMFNTGYLNEQSYREFQAIDLLKNLSIATPSNLTQLNIHDLKSILSAVRSEPNQKIVDIFKELELPNNQRLFKYFPEHFLEQYGQEGINNVISQKIDERFADEAQKNQVRHILLRFAQAGDSIQYIKLLDKILAIYDPLDTVEKRIFIAKLASAEGLYRPIQALSDDNNIFLALLDGLIKLGSPNPLLQLIAAERQIIKDPQQEQGQFFTSYENAQGEQAYVIENLAEKALCYVDALIPAITRDKTWKVSPTDLTPRVLTFLLKTPAKQLNTKSEIARPEIAYFDQLSAVLTPLPEQLKKGERISFKPISSAANNLMEHGGIQDSQFLKDFCKEIEQRKDPLTAAQKFNLINNPALLTLARYLANPSSIPEDKKQKWTPIFHKHPNLLKHKDYLNALSKNPEFSLALAEPDVFAAAIDNQLLDDGHEKNFETVIKALGDDLEGIHQFNEKANRVQQTITEEAEAIQKYPGAFMFVLKQMNDIIDKNPVIKQSFLDLIDRYFLDYQPTVHGDALKYLADFITPLEKTFDTIPDKNIVLSLCMQFSGAENGRFNPAQLFHFLHQIADMPVDEKLLLIKISIALMNVDEKFSLNNLYYLQKMLQQTPALLPLIQTFYEKPPYPSYRQLHRWHIEAQGDMTQYETKMLSLYQAFDLEPSPRNDQNGLNRDKVAAQIPLFKCDDPTILHVDPTLFQTNITFMRKMSSNELLLMLNRFRKQADSTQANPIDYDRLVAVMAELFYRSTGLEINTTQYLAVLTMLKAGTHVTSQIGTGEGKSRIMMIANACQFALGKTVDFVTSDLQLATRDYVKYQPYFEMIGAKTSMIFANSDPNAYQKGGVNFSDPSNLSLFRNKARSTGLGDLVIDQQANRRALLLDEADKTYFDVADTRFNFSKEGDELTRDMAWVYPLLMDYFAQEAILVEPAIDGQTQFTPMALYAYADISREQFMAYAKAHCDESRYNRLQVLSDAQIEQWQVSAVTAKQLKFKTDFVIEPDALITTPQGPKIASEAQLLFSNRISKDAKFSFGVHQCLHARLNRAHIKPALEQDPELQETLKACEQGFYIADEKQIVYSSTNKNLLDDYVEGTLQAVTGTSGSIMEREEATELYAKKNHKMIFIDVPREKGLKRQDKCVRLTADPEQQLKLLIKQIKAAREKNQPILIIAENDAESKALYNIISRKLPSLNKQHIHSQLSLKEESKLIGEAGKPGMITISTDMMGRGTDISLKDASALHGLNVMLTYLPRQRDLEQIIGRSGRFGAPGESSLVLNKQALKKQFGKQSLTDGFYTHTEAYIQREQAIMDRNKQVERLIKNTVGDFRKKLIDNFFYDLMKQVPNEQRRLILPKWTAFFEKSDKAWNEQWPLIREALKANLIDKNEVNRLLGEYQATTQKLWNTLRADVQQVDLKDTDQHPIATDSLKVLKVQLPVLELDSKTSELLSKEHPSTTPLKRTIYDQYDPAHDGRAVVYRHWSIPVLASLKGWANLLPFVNFPDARRPFANIRAWLEGRGQLFTNFRASGHKGLIIGAWIGTVIGGALGVALLATGVLAPAAIPFFGLIGILPSIAAVGTVGAIAGMSLGALTGLGVDAALSSNKNAPPPANAANKKPDEDEDKDIVSSQGLELLNIPPTNSPPTNPPPAHLPSPTASEHHLPKEKPTHDEASEASSHLSIGKKTSDEDHDDDDKPRPPAHHK